MTQINLQHFIDSEFPPVLRAYVPSALASAYTAVDELYDTVLLFTVTSARFNKGHVISWAVDFQIERLLKDGKLPFDYKWVPFDQPTGKYLQIYLPASTLSISQLPLPAAVPRHASFRHNRVLNNAPLLDFPEFQKEQRVTGLPHLILAHGYQQLSFAHIGVCDPESAGWIYRTPNLLKMPHAIESAEPKAEAADVDAEVTLREELMRWARDHANDA